MNFMELLIAKDSPLDSPPIVWCEKCRDVGWTRVPVGGRYEIVPCSCPAGDQIREETEI